MTEANKFQTLDMTDEAKAVLVTKKLHTKGNRRKSSKAAKIQINITCSGQCLSPIRSPKTQFKDITRTIIKIRVKCVFITANSGEKVFPLICSQLPQSSIDECYAQKLTQITAQNFVGVRYIILLIIVSQPEVIKSLKVIVLKSDQPYHFQPCPIYFITFYFTAQQPQA